jgi:YHS domain-containing protein
MILNVRIAGCFLLISALAAAGCNQVRVIPGQSATGISPIATDAVENYIPHKGEYNQVVQCPVCGQSVTVGRGVTGAEYQGEKYFFCGPECRESFKKQPKEYIKPK